MSRTQRVLHSWLAGGALVLLLAAGSTMADQGGKQVESLCQSIPCGHLPPPGECRVWFLGLPPGQQPPPGDCHKIIDTAPPDAWIIYG